MTDAGGTPHLSRAHSLSSSLPRREGTQGAPQTKAPPPKVLPLWFLGVKSTSPTPTPQLLLNLIESSVPQILLYARCQASCMVLGIQRKIGQSPCSQTSLADRVSHKGTLSWPISFFLPVQGIPTTQHAPVMTTIYKLVSHTLPLLYEP